MAQVKKKTAGSRRKGSIFGTAYLIGFYIFAAAGLCIVANTYLGWFDLQNRKVFDTHLSLKNLGSTISSRNQSGASVNYRSNKISSDIVIVGIDSDTLLEYGKWPFPRNDMAELLDSISGITDQNRRESAILMDFLYFDVGDRAWEDIVLLDSLRRNGNVLLQLQPYYRAFDSQTDEIGFSRLKGMAEKFGTISNISGDTSQIIRWYGVEAPLKPYYEAAAMYGFPTFHSDHDDIYRDLRLFSAISEEVGRYPVDDIPAEVLTTSTGPGHVGFMDRNNKVRHVFPLPLDDESFASLKERIAKRGVPDTVNGSYWVSVYHDYYIPSTGLSLALRYFNKQLRDVEIEVGSYLRIPNPQHWDSTTGTWVPYELAKGRRGRTEIIDEIVIPIDESGRMRINYMGKRSSTNRSVHSTFTTRSFATIAKFPESEKEKPKTRGLDGKVVMVGAFTQAMADDEKATPMGMMFGVEVHANALNTILMNNFVIEAGLAANLILALLVVGLVTVAASGMKKIGWSLPLFIAITILSFLAVHFVFTSFNYLLEWFIPGMAGIVSYLAVILYRVLIAERDRRQIKNTFGQYISPKVVEQLVESDEPPKLGGEQKDVTVFFSDIRQFSMISEKLNDSEKLVTLLNNYLGPMTDNIVDENDGTFDKYIGDAIMAFWGSPGNWDPKEHAVAACKSALKQLEILKTQVNTWIQEQRERVPDYPIDTIDIGIGLHSGKATIGNMGKEGRYNYTAMGDAVNLASRLEGVNKAYGTRIIISEETRRRIADEPFIVRELDTIQVVGRYSGETIYELVDYDGEL